MEDHDCVERVLNALVQGTGAEWSENSVLAHGFCARKNRLGNAIDHLISHTTHENMNLCVFLLATELHKARICKDRDSVNLANDALGYWLTCLCPHCKGAGKDFNQVDCPHCGGTGRKERPKIPGIRAAISLIEASIDIMEHQLRRKLRAY